MREVVDLVDADALEEEFTAQYNDKLTKLSFNSKPLITELSNIAEESLEFGSQVVDCIVKRIIAVRVCSSTTPLNGNAFLLYARSLMRNNSRESL